jgi:uncharacterized protein (UPF0305 family)
MSEAPTKMDEILIAQVIDLFEKKNFKKKLIKKLNNSVDVPFINEKTEKVVLNKMYDLLVTAVKDLTKDDDDDDDEVNQKEETQLESNKRER